MYYDHGQPVAEALPFKLGDAIVLPSGRIGILASIGRLEATFRYGNVCGEEEVTLSRRAVISLIGGQLQVG